MSSMEIEDFVSKSAAQPIAVHPLAIVNMSDQFTRITTGGSPLLPESAVVGLLFGQTMSSASNSDDTNITANPPSNERTSDNNKAIVTITDAEDIDFQNFEQQIALHQAVYPQNQIVGWYRVIADSQQVAPTEADLSQTQQLASKFLTNNSIDSNTVFIFALLQVPVHLPERKSDTEEQQQKQELPLQFFGLYENCLVHHPHWTLVTDKAEQFAVERVLRERVNASNSNIVAEKTREISASIKALDQRLASIQSYLEQQLEQQNPKGEKSSSTLTNLRDIKGFLCHAQYLGGLETFTNTVPSMHPLDTLAKTVDQLHSYTDKLKKIGHHGTSPTSTSTRSQPRGAIAMSSSASDYPFPK